eukprot:4544080-Amphidinium_carterae.1
MGESVQRHGGAQTSIALTGCANTRPTSKCKESVWRALQCRTLNTAMLARRTTLISLPASIYC